LQQGLRFRGLMAHRGQFRLPDTREKHLLVCSAIQSVIDSKNLIEREGIPSELVSSGGTSDCAIVGAFPGVTEIQAGSYLLMDSWYVPFAPDFKPGLTVLTTVISCNPGRIVVDAGAKAMSAQKGLPMVKGFGGLRVKALHAEHAIIEILEPQAGVEVGDKLEIWVQHLDSTVSLHKRMYGIRKGKVEEVFQIEC